VYRSRIQSSPKLFFLASHLNSGSQALKLNTSDGTEPIFHGAFAGIDVRCEDIKQMGHSGIEVKLYFHVTQTQSMSILLTLA
jgi:hypothetical protein